jgi:hypothetical protein
MDALNAIHLENIRTHFLDIFFHSINHMCFIVNTLGPICIKYSLRNDISFIKAGFSLLSVCEKVAFGAKVPGTLTPFFGKLFYFLVNY